MTNPTKPQRASLRLELDADTTRRLDRYRNSSIGRVSRTQAAVNILVSVLAAKTTARR